MTEAWVQVGVDYCVTHHGIRNEDMRRCDFVDGYETKDPPVDPEDFPCDLRPLGYLS